MPGLQVHKCYTDDIAIVCVCSTGRDHNEDEMDLVPEPRSYVKWISPYNPPKEETTMGEG